MLRFPSIARHGIRRMPMRQIHVTPRRYFDPLIENVLLDLKDEVDKDPTEDKKPNSKRNRRQNTKKQPNFERTKAFLTKCAETIGITLLSIAMLGVAGLLYHKFYHIHVLQKMDATFEKGDPASHLVIHSRTHDESLAQEINDLWVDRPQQQLLDGIISGQIIGRYFLIVGEKGTGKTSMILEGIKKVEGYNVAMFDAHADPEIFRLRLGKALNFTFNEDYIGSLFSIRGPRDTTALLDIERAFTKLEELAIRRVPIVARPLILIINNSHLIKDNEEGIKLLEMIQQKAEGLSGSGLVTIIFNSDDYWVYEKLKKLGTRLELINVRDFNRKETVSALKYTRNRYFPEIVHKLSDEHCNQIYDLIGGRPQHISQVARHRDMITACHEIIDREKTWFLNQCGLLGDEMDDDVMESGKFSTSAMLLMREFVEMDRNGKSLIKGTSSSGNDHRLPELPLWRSRQIMTRNDYIQHYDNLNIFTIDSESRVRADSVPMMRAFHEIASQPHFDRLLRDTIQRVADIEALGRTREIVAKDLTLGSTYSLTKKDQGVELLMNQSYKQKALHGDFTQENSQEEEDCDEEDDLFLEGVHRKENRKWWKKRIHLENFPEIRTRKEYDIDLNREQPTK